MPVPRHPVFARMPVAFTGALGYAVTVSPAGGAARVVQAIVRASYAELAGQTGMGSPGIKGRRVPASFVEDDVPGLRDGDAVTVVNGGPIWRVREPEADGRGMVRCELERD